MKVLNVLALGLTLAAGPLLADGHASGDAAAGEGVYKKCKSCHAVTDNDGNVLVKGGRTGPNLYGINGRVAGAADGFKFGKSIVEAGEAGLTWDEANFVGYVADPKGFLRTTLDDKKAKSKMSYKLKSAEDAADVWAYLVSLGPDAN